MYKYSSYIWLIVAVLLLQIFLLDNLSIALWLRPMIFPLVVLLLPMEWRSIWVLLATLAVGCVMDLALGGAGLYTASLLPLAILRPTIIYLTTRRQQEPGDQQELLARLGLRQMMLYMVVALLLHHTLYFMLETLSLAQPLLLVATILASTLCSVVIAWPIVRLFLSKIVVK